MNDFPIIPATKLSISQRTLVFGVGINDSDYATSANVGGLRVVCPVYRKWRDMLMRCYSARYQEKYPSYAGCYVVDEWLTFSNFSDWMVSNDYEGLELDKDILFCGNKVYSPSTCVFVKMKINRLLNNHRVGRGGMMLGVSKSYGRFKSSCRSDGKTVYLGRFDSEIEAHDAYKEFKYSIIKKLSDGESEQIKSALLRYVIPKY